jgi:D-beta-D-heptose 7-phosphate kinase/D-beta-D-heptose 1-phosphate adenosyltransferase
MGFDERLYIMQELKGTAYAVGFDDSDNSACDLIKTTRDKYGSNVSIAFANGGDRVRDNIPEVQTCLDYDVEMVWNVGGGKIQSSSDLIKNSQHS